MHARTSTRWISNIVAMVGVVAITVAGLSGVAQAAPVPADAAAAAEAPPATVTADALPTWQINGVVWSQAIIGDIVYVTGSFTRARPPGVAAGGAGEVVANNIFAYRLSTGDRVASFATTPGLNAQGLVIRASADGSRLWVGGDFTTVNGTARGHLAALNPADGSLVTGGGFVPPNVGGQVRGLGITPTTVYVGGNFTSANGVARTRLAAFQTGNGAMTGWAPAAAGGYVWAMTMSPDKTRVIPAGSFTTLAGQPAYGMGSLMASDGSVNPWPAQDRIRDAGADGAITSIKADGTQIYGTAYSFTQNGTADWEGTFAIDPTSGQINWANDCLGDTYDIAPAGDVLYNASHQHDCTVVGGWPDTNPRVRWQKAAAQYSHTSGDTTTKDDAYGWAGSKGLVGVKYAKLLHWYPNFAFGSYTSAGQAAWAVDASSDGQFVVYGGEFPRVNNVAQQGIVRFRTSAGAPNKSGPTYSTTPATPTPTTNAVSLSAGTARVSWGSAWDMDDHTLTYDVLRDNNTWVYSTTGDSNFWTLPGMGFTDKNLAVGSTHKYQVRITDPKGNTLWSPISNTVTVSNGSPSPYAQKVIDDGANHLWRLSEPSGNAYDWAGFDDLTMSGGYTRGADGAIIGDTDKSTNFGGADGFGATTAPIAGPDVFSIETWFRTTTTDGGKLVGFGNANTGTSSNYDRHIYMEPDGRITFGVYNNGSYTTTSPRALNDGQWHQAVGTMGPSGLTLYIDGKRVGTNGGTSMGQPYSGYWRVGGDSPWSGHAYFTGDIDDVAIYPTTIPVNVVQSHYTASGRTLNIPTRPSDTYGGAIWDSSPDLYWRLGEASGSTAADSSPNEFPGVYNGGTTYDASGAVTGTGNTAVTFDGSTGGVASAATVSNPSVYSEELWFKTTTQSGGKLIGFGSSQTGNSGSYDRHVYMFDDGRLRFGVWTGFTNVIDTPLSYNDGNWHHMVATQGSDGMKLYVDGQLTGTNGQTQSQAYDGYWRVGGDTTWGGNSSNWFAGSIDEVAVYSSALSASTVQQHFASGGGAMPNQPPTAAFTHTESGLTTSVDASTSSDPDGTVASYAWDFGDGGTATGKTPAGHPFGSAGTYAVKLTVTDDKGATNSTTQQVTVTAPPANQPPTAAFTHTESGLTTSVDASTSSDPDGTVASYAWDFGDGGTATGKTPAGHPFGSAGTYAVKLTVTDDKGATNSTTQQVTVTAPPANQPPTAAFTHTESGLTTSVDASTSSDPDGTVASYAWDFGDGGTATGKTPAGHPFGSAGTYAVKLTVTDDKGATNSTTQQVTVTAPVDPAYATDAFNRTVANGWGNADLGGAWTVSGALPKWSVNGTAGGVSLAAGGSGTATLSSVSKTDTEVAATLSTDKAATGGGQYLSVIARQVGPTTDYRGKVQFRAGGTVAVVLSKMVSGTETAVSSTVVLPGVTIGAGEKLQVRVQAVGTGSTTLRLKAWKGATEPAAWTLNVTDNTSGLQSVGAAAFYLYLSSGATNPPTVFNVDDLWVGPSRP